MVITKAWNAPLSLLSETPDAFGSKFWIRQNISAKKIEDIQVKSEYKIIIIIIMLKKCITLFRCQVKSLMALFILIQFLTFQSLFNMTVKEYYKIRLQ